MSDLAHALRTATKDAHGRAERSGVMRRLLRGGVERWRYAVLLRNLHALYAALEAGLDAHAAQPAVAAVHDPALARADAIASDLRLLDGDAWATLPLTAAARAYVARLAALAAAEPPLLVAHAYVRYLGDLAGGQQLRRLVPRALDGDGPVPTATYEFPDVTDAAARRDDYRAALAALPVDAATADAIVAEAVAAFERHVALFEEIDALVMPGTSSTPSTPAAPTPT